MLNGLGRIDPTPKNGILYSIMLGFMFTVRVRFPVKFGKMSASRSKRIIKPPRNISPETTPTKRKRASATTEPAAKVSDIFFLSNSRCESYESVSLTTLNRIYLILLKYESRFGHSISQSHQKYNQQ